MSVTASDGAGSGATSVSCPAVDGFSAVDSGSASPFTCTYTRGAGALPGTSPVTESVTVTDAAGNTSSASTFTVVTDASAPGVSAGSPALGVAGLAISGTTVYYGATVGSTQVEDTANSQVVGTYNMASNSYLQNCSTASSITTCDLVLPAGVTTISAVVVGGGGGGAYGSTGGAGGGGGGLAYSGSVDVSACTTLQMTIGNGGTGASYMLSSTAVAGQASTLRCNGTTLLSGGGGLAASGSTPGTGGASAGTQRTGGGTGGAGAADGLNGAGGGGGAAGYSGNGGAGGAGSDNGNSFGTGTAGSGGGGGGGEGDIASSNTGTNRAGSGGGVGLLGAGANGSAGGTLSAGDSGGGGSGGTSGTNAIGGTYGGGGAGGDWSGSTATCTLVCQEGVSGASGGKGGVRIIWGSGRSYPSTNTADTSLVSTYGAFSIAYALTDNVGVAAAACPATFSGFTLTSGTSPALPTTSTTLTCTYTGDGTATPAGTTTPTAGSTSDGVANASAISAGFTGVQDALAPTVTISSVIELVSGSSADASEIHVVESGGAYTISIDDSTIPATQAFRVTYALSDAGSGLASASCPSAPVLGDATGSPFTLAESISPALPGASATLTCTYTGDASDVGVAGTYAAGSANGGTTPDATDGVGNVTAIGTAVTYVVDGTAPTVSSFTSAVSSPTNSSSIEYTLTFDEPVSGIAAGDFANAGTATGCTFTPSAASGTTITLTVTTCSTTGTLTPRLTANLVNDLVGNTGPAANSSATTTLTLDRVAPSVSSFTSAVSSPTNSTSIAYTLTMSESVSGIAAGDFENAGTATSCTFTPSGSGASYTVTVTDCSSTGSLQPRLLAGSVSDSVTNTGPAADSVATTTLALDRVAPTAYWVSGSYPGGSALSFDFQIGFSESVSGIAAEDFENAGTATGCVFTPAASSYTGTWITLTVTGCGLSGTLTPHILADSVSDTVGNLGPAATTHFDTVIVDRIAPIATIDLQAASDTGRLNTDDLTNAAAPVFTVTFNETVKSSSVAAGDFSNVGTASCTVSSAISASSVTATVTLGCTTEGTIILRLAANGIDDTAGNFAAQTDGPTVTRDVTAPTLTLAAVTASPTTSTSLSFTLTAGEALDCSTISATSGIDFNLTNITAPLGTITGSGTTTCTIAATSSVAAAASGSSTLTRATSFSVADDAGNAQTLISSGSPASVTVDRQAPSVSSFTSAVSSPTNSTSIDYTLTFSESVSGIAAGDFANAGTATSCTFTPSDASGASITLTVTDCSTSGTLQPRLAAAGVTDTAGNTNAQTDATTTLTLDRVAPSISAFTSAVSSPTNSTSIAYTLTFSESVSGIAAGDFANAGTATSCTFTPSAASGSSITLTVTTCSTTGTLQPRLLADGVTDTASNTGPAADSNATTTLTLDRVVPSVSAFSCTPAEGTVSNTSLSCSLTFSEAPGSNAFSPAADLTIGGTATTWSAGSATGSGVGPYAFTVSRGAPAADGTLTLTVAAGAINDAATNSSSASGTLSYTIDTTAPTVSSFTSAVSSPANTTSIDYTLTFSESVSGIAAGDFANAGTATSCTFTPSDASGASITLTVTDCSTSGTLQPRLAAAGVTDTAGNTGPAANADATTTLTLDRVAPSVSSIALQAASDTGRLSNDRLTNASSPVFDLTFSESVTGVASGDFSTTGTATGCTFTPSGSGTTYTVTVASCSAGTLILTFAAAGAIDTAGNTGPAAAAAAATVTIDRTAPTLTLAAVTASPTNSTSLSFTLAAGEALDCSTISTANGTDFDLTNIIAPLGTITGSGTTTCTIAATSSVAAAASGSSTLTRATSFSVADDAGNAQTLISSGSPASVTVDRQAPSVSAFSCTPAAGTVNTTSLSCSVTFSEAPGSNAFSPAADLTIGGTATTWSAGVATGSGVGPYTFTVSRGAPAADGTLTLTVAADAINDAVANSSTASDTLSYTIDTTAPTVSSFTSAVSSPTNSTSIAYTLTFSESVSGIAAGDFANAGTATSCTFTPSDASGASITLTVTDCSTSGTLQPRLAAAGVTDTAGNTNAQTDATTTLTLDRVAPSISAFTSAVSSPTNSTSIAYTLTFSESVSGIAAGDFANAGTATSCTFTPSAASGSSITLTVTDCSTSGTLQPRLLADGVVDTAGNTGPAANADATTTLTLDRVAPTVSSFTSAVSSPANSASIAYTLTFSESVSGIASGDFANAGTATGCTFTSSASSGSSIALTVTTCSTSGTLQPRLLAGGVADTAGNTGPAANSDATTTLTLDRVAPTVSSFTSAVSSPTNSTSIAYTLTFSESVSGIASGDFENAGTATSCTFTPSAASGSSITLTVTDCSTSGTLQPRLLADGVTDTAGNTGPAANSDATTTLTLDRVAPTAGSASISESSAALSVSGTTLFYNSASAQSTSFTVTLAPTDAASGIASVAFPAITGLGTTPTNGPSTDTTSPYSFAYAFGTGALTATGNQTLTTTDNAANTATTTVTLTADTTAPANTALALSTGACGTWQSAASATVTPSGATDAGAGFLEYRYTTDGSTPTTSSTLYTSPISVSAQGTTTVRVVAVDNVGNVSTAASCSVQLDNVNPTTGSAAISESSTALAVSGTTLFYNSATAQGVSFTVTLTPSDADSGIASVLFPAVTGLGSTPTNGPSTDTTSTYSFAYAFGTGALTATGNQTLTTTDNAANTATTTVTLTADTTAPANTALALSTGACGTWQSAASATVTPSGATDAGAGFLEYRYTTDGSTPTASSTLYSTPISVATQGTTTVRVVAVDNVGNVSAAVSCAVQLDTVAPAISWTTPSAAAYRTTAAYTPAWSVTDDVSGVSGSGTVTRYRATLSANSCGSYLADTATNGGSTQTNGGAITLTSGFCYYWSFTAAPTDAAGNTTSGASLTSGVIKVDTSAPSGTVRISESSSALHAVTTTLYYNSATASGSAFVVTYDSTLVAGAATPADAQTGVASVTFPSIAGLGTGAINGSQVDTTAPYTTTGGVYTFGTGALTAAGAKSNTLANNAGLSTGSTFTMTIDITAPAISWTTPSAAAYRTTTAYTPAWTVTDAGSGVASSGTVTRYKAALSANACGAYSVDAVQTNGGAITLADASCYYWTFTAAPTDNVGNTTSANLTSTVVKVDTAAPTISWTTPSAAAYAAAGSYTPAWTVTDAVSGVASSGTVTRYKATLSGATCGAYSVDAVQTNGGAVALAAGSCYYWSFTAAPADNAGNVASGASLTSSVVKVDSDAPSITWTTPAAGTSLSSSTSISLAFSTSDGGAGLASVSLQRQKATVSIPGSCAGVAWSDDGSAVDVLGLTSRSVTGLLTGSCYRWTITATDQVGNESSSTSGVRLVDTSAPTFGVSATGGYANGTTVYIGASASGTVTLTATAADDESGIAGVTFGALSATTGYTPGSSLPLLDTSAPYSLAIDFTSAAVSTSLTVSTENGTGATASSTISIVPDGSAPSISVTSPVSFTIQAATAISLAWEESDASGVASRSVQRKRAAIPASGSCADASYSNDGAATTAGSSRSDSNLATGYCYRYVITATDNVGNEGTTTSAAVLVDETAPSTPSATATGASTYLTGATLFFRSAVAGSATVAASAADAQSGIALLRFAGTAGSGWTPSSIFAETDATDPYSVELSWDTGAAGGWTLAIDARNGAQSYGSAIELAITADGTAPEGTFTTPAGGAQATGSISVDWTESDGAGSGIASRSLQRYVGTIVTPGSCVAVADWTVSGAATTTVAPRSDTGLTTGFCYRYVLTLTDRVGNASETTSSAVLVDTTAPDAPSVTATGAGIYQSAANGTIFFLPVADGSLALVATSSDAESGTASITFGAPSVTTGWTTTSGATDATSPYTRSYLFGATAVSSSIEVTATNGAGAASGATTLTLTADADDPTAGFTTLDETDTVAVTDGTYEVAWTESDGSGAGVVSRSLQRQKVAIDGTACPALGWANDGAATTTESPRAESGLLDGYCYRYRLTLVDGVGNSSIMTSGELIVDSSAPDAPEVTASGGKTHQVGTTVYFGAGSGTISFTATATDDGSGIALVSFGATDDDNDPYEYEESFTGASSSSTLTVTATNGVDTASNPTVLSLVPDRTAPSAAFSSPAAGLTRQSTATTGISWSSSDAGSGVATRSLQREIAEIPSTGSCTDATWTTDGSAESVVAAGSATVEGLTDARCYRWTLTVTDNVGNETVTTSGGVLVDTSAPSTPSATASGAGVYQSAADAVVYFRAGAAGSLSISVTAADAESGVTLVRFAYATGASTSGWTPSATLPAEDAVSPYTLGLAWSGSAASTALEIIARNGTGADSAIRTLTISADGNAPTVSITSPTSPTTSTNGNLSVTYSATDGGSGVASVAVQRYRAAIPGSLDCTEVATWSTDGLPTSGASPREDTGLASGYCYRYGVTATDRVGNAASESFSAPVVVDSSAPDAPTLELSADVAGKLYVAAGGTVWFRAGSGGTLTIAVTAADTQTGVDTIAFAALTSTTGWSPTSAATTSYNAAASNTKSYTWSGGASGATFSVSATNGAGSTGAAATLILTADSAAPSISWTSPEAATTNPSADATDLVFSISDSGSGVASAVLQRQRAATTLGACPGAGSFTNDGGLASIGSSPISVTGLATGYCYRWIITAADRVGQQASATSGTIRIDTTYSLNGVPQTIAYDAGKPGDLVSSSSFTAVANAAGPYSLTLSVSEMTRRGGSGVTGDVIAKSAFRFVINGTTYYAGSTGIIVLSKGSGSTPTGQSAGDEYVVLPKLTIPFVSTGTYDGTFTFVIDGIGQ